MSQKARRVEVRAKIQNLRMSRTCRCGDVVPEEDYETITALSGSDWGSCARCVHVGMWFGPVGHGIPLDAQEASLWRWLVKRLDLPEISFEEEESATPGIK